MIRPEIMDFALGMQKQIEKHRHSHGEAWKGMHPMELFVYLLCEIGKLAFALRVHMYKAGALEPDDSRPWSEDLDQIAEYARDVANLAMMIEDRVRILSEKD